jgi:hypothetical protein
MKIRVMRAEVCNADGDTDVQLDRQTDTTKLIVAFRNFAKAPTNKSDTSKTRVK